MNNNLNKEAENQPEKNKKNDVQEKFTEDQPQGSLQTHQADMGEMAGYLAHQWKQPLNTINLILVDLQDALRHNELDQQYMDASVERARKVIDSMVETIDEFRNFFKLQEHKNTFGLRDQVEWALSFIRSSMEIAGIRVNNTIAQGVSITGFSNDFSQVMISVINCCRLLLLAHKPENPSIEISAALQTDTVIVRISGKGAAIPEKDLSGIFDIPETISDKTKNGYVNLYPVKENIRQRLNGEIIVKNIKNSVEFTIHLPLM